MYIHPSSKSLILKLRDPQRVINVLGSSSKLISVPEGNIAVRHNLETTRVLRNMGIKCPSPILGQYNWPGRYKPYDHQRIMADAMTTNEKVFNLSEMGTGKTYATLWAADYLMNVGLVKRALILAPLGTLVRVWQKDLFEILMHRSCVITHGDQEKRNDKFNMDVDFYITNHDAVTHKDVARLIRRREDIDLVIVDEASFFRNHDTKKYKYLSWALYKKPRVWPLTGTPYANGPTDAWALARLICPQLVPDSFPEFQRKTCVQLSDRKWVPRKGAEDIVYKAMQPAIRFKKDECLDLPPVTLMERQTVLTAEQRKHFKSLRDDMVAQVSSGVPITAVNAADAINKIRQVFCGVIKNPTTGQYEVIDHKPRTAELISVIDEAAAKVIVIVPFKGIIQSLEHELSKVTSVAVLNGDVTINRRNAIIRDFKEQADPHTLLCHPRVMSHGLNLVEADTTVFYAPIYSHDEYAQVIERMNRLGQLNPMTLARIAAHPLEWDIYRAVDNKALTQDNILRLYEQVLE